MMLFRVYSGSYTAFDVDLIFKSCASNNKKPSLSVSLKEGYWMVLERGLEPLRLIDTRSLV